MTFETKDSGLRQEFNTGSVRDTRDGKGRYDLLPFFGIRRLTDLYQRGAEKYGDKNWQKGQPLSRYIDSGLRHAFQAAAGYTDEDHLAAVVWNFLAIIDHQERIARGELPQGLDDLPTPAFPTPDEDLFTQTDDTAHDVAAVRRQREGALSAISTGERPYGGGLAYPGNSGPIGHNHD